MIKHYYAFLFRCGLNTTCGEGKDKQIAGSVCRFNSVNKRNKFIKEMNFTYLNDQKPCKVITRKEIFKMGHGDSLTDPYAFCGYEEREAAEYAIDGMKELNTEKIQERLDYYKNHVIESKSQEFNYDSALEFAITKMKGESLK